MFLLLCLYLLGYFVLKVSCSSIDDRGFYTVDYSMLVKVLYRIITLMLEIRKQRKRRDENMDQARTACTM